jgi:hypothetical protein
MLEEVTLGGGICRGLLATRLRGCATPKLKIINT